MDGRLFRRHHFNQLILRALTFLPLETLEINRRAQLRRIITSPRIPFVIADNLESVILANRRSHARGFHDFTFARRPPSAGVHVEGPCLAHLDGKDRPFEIYDRTAASSPAVRPFGGRPIETPRSGPRASVGASNGFAGASHADVRHLIWAPVFQALPNRTDFPTGVLLYLVHLNSGLQYLQIAPCIHGDQQYRCKDDVMQSHEIFKLSVSWVCLMEILLLVRAAVTLQCGSEIVYRLNNEEVNSGETRGNRRAAGAVAI